MQFYIFVSLNWWKIWTFEQNPDQIRTNLTKKVKIWTKVKKVEALQLYKGKTLQKSARLSSKRQNKVYFQQII